MAEIVLNISYVKEADFLEISWNPKTGYMDGTEHDRVLVNLDMEGNLQGFQIHGVTKLEDGVLKIPVPSPEKAEELERSQPEEQRASSQGVDTAERILKIWYIKEIDTLSVGWSDKAACYTGTDNDWVLAEVDMEGNFLGFEIEGVTQLGDDLLKVRIPSPEEVTQHPENRP